MIGQPLSPRSHALDTQRRKCQKQTHSRGCCCFCFCSPARFFSNVQFVTALHQSGLLPSSSLPSLVCRSLLESGLGLLPHRLTMRTPWLLRSDCLLAESIHHSIAGFHGSSFLSRQPCPLVYVCRSPVSTTCALVDPDASNWSPKVRSLVEACFRRTFSVGVAAARGPDVASTDDEFHGDDESLYDRELNRYRGLVLDVAYRPINVVCWRRALCLEILEKADVLEYYDQVINSPSRPFAIPAVLRITDYVHTPKRAKVRLALNRKNIYLRDKYKCQYCNSHENLTIDHVVPLSRGGGWTWQNLVTACAKCNARKSAKTPEEANMQLIKKPKEPKLVDGRDMPSNYAAYRTLQSARQMPDEWVDYLPKRAQASDSS